MWKINNMPINNQGVNRQMKENIKKYFATSGNRNTTFQNQ